MRCTACKKKIPKHENYHVYYIKPFYLWHKKIRCDKCNFEKDLLYDKIFPDINTRYIKDLSTNACKNAMIRLSSIGDMILECDKEGKNGIEKCYKCKENECNAYLCALYRFMAIVEYHENCQKQHEP